MEVLVEAARKGVQNSCEDVTTKPSVTPTPTALVAPLQVVQEPPTLPEPPQGMPLRLQATVNSILTGTSSVSPLQPPPPPPGPPPQATPNFTHRGLA